MELITGVIVVGGMFAGWLEGRRFEKKNWMNAFQTEGVDRG